MLLTQKQNTKGFLEQYLLYCLFIIVKGYLNFPIEIAPDLSENKVFSSYHLINCTNVF